MAVPDPGRFRVPGAPFNLADAFVLRHLREGRADRRALVLDAPGAPAREVSFAELASAASRFGHLLSSRGLRMEDRVLIVLEDGLDWAAAFFGAQLLGAVTAFVHPQVSDAELEFYLEDTRARVLVTTRAIAARVPHPSTVAVDDPEILAELESHPDTLEPAPTVADDFACWLYTSGSTGAPKAAVHRAGDFVFNTERYAKDVLGFSPDDLTLSVPKLFFGYATGSNLLFPLFFGASAVLFPDKPTPARLCELIERHRPTMLVAVPTLIAQLLAYLGEAEPTPDLCSLRLLTSAGEALPPELYRRWVDKTGVEILDGLGSAEMFHVFISNRPRAVVPGSLGILVPGYEARIVDPDGTEVPDGEIGTLHIGGASSAAFYFNRQEESRRVLQGHWVLTSDLVRRDENGVFWYHGRANETLKVGGRWVQPQEVEACLGQDPDVLEAAIAPFTEEGLTKPMAFVLPTPGAEVGPALEARLKDRVASALAPFKAPRFVVFVDSLPRGDRDKLDRAALAARAEEAAKARSS